MGKTIDKILNEVYYDLKSPASYAGILKILEEARKKNPKIKIEDVVKFLTKEKTYTLHKPIRKRFKRLKTVPSGFHTDWQCDPLREQYSCRTNICATTLPEFLSSPS